MVRQQEGGLKYMECMRLLGDMRIWSGKDM